MTPKITYPKVAGPMTGIRKKGNYWYAVYYEGPAVRLWKLVTPPAGTSGSDVARSLTQQRDTFYRGLRARGATVRGSTPKPVEGRKYIYYRKPWVVRIDSKVIGSAETVEEAEGIRDLHLKKG